MVRTGEIRLRSLACGASILVLAGGLAGPALAQSAAQQSAEVDEVVVTGFRAAIQSAIAVKREESGVVDAIKAEDIAKFPDNNLAESLQRIPGVAITRSAGEGRNITVRGLGPGSTRVRINGMEALTTTGGSDADGGANRNRQFDFNVFASELFNSLAVRKTASASVEEGSLGATVDLTTSRPFDFGRDQVLSLSGQMGYNDLSKSWDPRVAGLFSKTFLDDTFGVLVSVAYSERGVREEGFNTVRWGEGTSNGGWCSPLGYDTNPSAAGQQFNPTTAAAGSSATNCFAGDPRIPGTPEAIAAYERASDRGSWHPRIPRYARLDYDQERLGITGALQWKPTDRTTVSFDYLYSNYKSHRTENYLEAISFSRNASSPEFGKAYMIPRVFDTDEHGTLTYGEFDNVDIRIESREDKLETIFSQYSLSGVHELTDTIRISGMIGTSKSSFKNPIQTTITFDRANQDGWIYDARDNPLLPNITWGFDITDPNAFTFTNASANGTVRPSEVRLRPQFVQNSFDIGAGDIAWEMNDTFTLKVGATWKKYVNDGQEYRRASEFALPAMPSGVTMGSLSEQLTGFGDGLGGDGIPSGWVIPDFDAVAQAYGIYSGTGTFALLGIESSNARGSWRTVKEESAAYYAQVDFDTDILPWRLRGDFGVRYVDTDVTAQGYRTLNSAPSQITVENSYDNWLPSANVVAEVTPDFLVRAAAAKVMVRPGLGSLNPGGTFNTTGNLTISAGNPFLKPAKANTYDLSFEWYPGGDSLVALGFFIKDFKTDFSTVRLTGPFSSFGLPAELLEGTGRTPNDEAQYTTTINTKGGDPLKGFEVNVQQPFTFLVDRFGMPEWTGNFGALFNYTYVKGTSIFCAGTPVNGECPANLTLENRPTNVSKNAYNATLFYEDAKFSARVSLSHRSKYLFAVPSGNQGNLTTGRRQDFQDADWVPSTTTVDANVSYQLTEKLRLTLEALNLTDEESRQFNDTDAQRVWTNHHFGRQFYFGARYSF
ncbi:TonB-dependent receptor [Phenylobacterium zucineum HLK1]|uniref:TonB-dependent receptor n=1 Tax=Phenylobacterium zucineum (strain HLK1) TaxID=450851 RepID=B4RGG3_PHEZH|nr:TonB-dependent receptor [Phenylobacterium zucineum]ACG78869.1 TonB-dependent receptor [Phenylobacterium zucineum HLK1]